MTEYMREIQTIALRMMNATGLIDAGWTFRWSSARRYYGQCDYRKKRISLSSKNLRDLPDVIYTIWHEIAHAILPGHKHDEYWQSAVRILQSIKLDKDGRTSAGAEAVINFIQHYSRDTK